jgi:uncharacterized protein (TIGR03083 family)
MAMEPIDTAPLFAPLHAELIELLSSLTPDQWLLPTVAGHWRVRDVAAHLLDTQLRRLSAQRDRHFVVPDPPLDSPAAVAAFVNALNATGVAFGARLSPRILTSLLAETGPALNELVASLPLHGPALWPVSWAGETESRNWMDIGREYTERWHHQQQIRDAAGAPLLLAPRWVDPLLDIAVRVLPAAYANTEAETGTALVFEVAIDDESPRAWTLSRAADGWTLDRGGCTPADCVIRTTADAAWRLFFSALPDREARAAITISGHAALAEPLMRARSVVL